MAANLKIGASRDGQPSKKPFRRAAADKLKLC
jgi:hypothetical protein